MRNQTIAWANTLGFGNFARQDTAAQSLRHRGVASHCR